jgi:hypothetical protein
LDIFRVINKNNVLLARESSPAQLTLLYDDTTVITYTITCMPH